MHPGRLKQHFFRDKPALICMISPVTRTLQIVAVRPNVPIVFDRAMARGRVKMFVIAINLQPRIRKRPT